MQALTILVFLLGLSTVTSAILGAAPLGNESKFDAKLIQSRVIAAKNTTTAMPTTTTAVKNTTAKSTKRTTTKSTKMTTKKMTTTQTTTTKEKPRHCFKRFEHCLEHTKFWYTYKCLIKLKHCFWHECPARRCYVTLKKCRRHAKTRKQAFMCYWKFKKCLRQDENCKMSHNLLN